jgi:hypothetical protein
MLPTDHVRLHYWNDDLEADALELLRMDDAELAAVARQGEAERARERELARRADYDLWGIDGSLYGPSIEDRAAHAADDALVRDDA